MPTTIRNTDILFNDGTTQTTAATPSGFPASISAGTIQCALRASPGSSSTSFVLGSPAYILRGGTIRTRLRAAGGSSNYGNGQGNGRVFINGVGVGSEVASSGLNYGGVLQQDLSVNAGDIIQAGYRRTGGDLGAAGTAEVALGVATNQQITVVFSNAQNFSF